MLSQGSLRPPEPIRVGLIVPSSNVTMERELPAMLHNREAVEPERFSLHTSRVRMRSVTPEELLAMNAQAVRAAQELADASVQAAIYACLVAVMADGPGAHREAEARLSAVFAAAGCPVPVITSAGALVDTLQELGVRRIAVIAPYFPALTHRMCDYLSAEGVSVVEARSLAVADNGAVGRLDPRNLLQVAAELPRHVDAVVLSACVQMPSLAVIEAAEAQLGLPVISAATATMFQLLRRLGLRSRISGAGRLLSGMVDRLVFDQLVIGQV